MQKQNGFRVLNYIGFNAGWAATVWGAGNGLYWLGPLATLVFVPLHIGLSPNPRGEARLLLVLAVLGTILETGFMMTGVVTYRGTLSGYPLVPFYITTLWMMYGSTLNHSMGWMRRSWQLALVAGLVFGPFSYIVAERLGAVTLEGGFISLVILALAWGPANAGSVALAMRFEA